MGFWKLKPADVRIRLRGKDSGGVGGYRYMCSSNRQGRV